MEGTGRGWRVGTRRRNVTGVKKIKKEHEDKDIRTNESIVAIKWWGRTGREVWDFEISPRGKTDLVGRDNGCEDQERVDSW